MRRFNLFRAVGVLLVGIVGLIALWFGLPFPESPKDAEKARVITNTLRAGARLTTVHRFGHLARSPGYLKPKGLTPRRYGTYDATIFEWQLSQQSTEDSILLQVGEPQQSSPDFHCFIDITRLANSHAGFLNESCYIWTKAGDQDGLSPPYFDYADATLLYHQSGNTWQDVSLQMLVPEQGVLELWKYLPDWTSYDASDIAQIDAGDRSLYLIATFDVSAAIRDGKVPQLAEMEVFFQDGMLPTSTLPIRQLIFSLLAPMYFAMIWTFETLVYPVATLLVYAVLFATILLTVLWTIAYLCWFYSGTKRAFGKWTRDFWMTKHIVRILLGPGKPRTWAMTGPLDEDDIEDDDHHRRKRCPKPLSGVLDFFRSPSPLDDLLFTFPTTRWMVQPIGQKPGREHSGIYKQDSLLKK